jgi:hypothetical protein
MGEVCSAHGGGDMRTKFWFENSNRKDHLEDIGIDGSIILKLILRNGVWGVDWIYLAQARDCWRHPVNAVMNLLIPYKAGNLTS